MNTTDSFLELEYYFATTNFSIYHDFQVEFEGKIMKGFIKEKI